MSTVSEALIVNAVVLFAVLEADLGTHRKIGPFRIIRPLLMAGVIVPLFIKSPATHGTGVALELAGVCAGIVLGLIGTALMKVYRSPRTGRPVTRAAFGCAALWILVIGARSAFSYGSDHWFASSLDSWSVRHSVTSGAITNTLILMAVAMVITRTFTITLRGISHRATPRSAQLTGAR